MKHIQSFFDFKKRQSSFDEYYKIGIFASSFHTEEGYWRFMEYIGKIYKHDLDNFKDDRLFFFLSYGVRHPPDDNALKIGRNINPDIMSKLLSMSSSTLLDSRHCMMLTLFLHHVKPDSTVNYCEIGGGYGNFCRLIHKYIGFKSWTIFDLSFVSDLQDNYLSKRLPTVSLNREALSPVGINLVNTNNRNEAAYLLKDIDVTFATHSLSEFSFNEFMWYYNNILTKTKYLLYATQINPNISTAKLCKKKMTYLEMVFFPVFKVSTEDNNVLIILYIKI